MSSSGVEPRQEASLSTPVPVTISWYWAGLANLVVVVLLSLVSWWIFADPAWGFLNAYPQPVTAALLWIILITVFVGFNLEFAGLARLKQPARGFAAIAVIAVIATAILLVVAYGWGSIDRTFAASRADGLGYQTASLFVLFGFLTYVMVVVNWQHWPWSARGLKQPWAGLGDIALMAVPTLILFLVFALPDLALWGSGKHVLNVNTSIGVFYSIIVSIVLTGLSTENWPWKRAGGGGRVALASTIGNVVFGIVIYFALLGVSRLIIGSKNMTDLGPASGVMAAQFGVCWVFWMIIWANAFQNWPARFPAAANYAARFVITFVLGLGTFVLYFYVLAGQVLHEPQLVGSLHGNALGFIDWLVMWALFYIVCFESFGLPKPRPLPA